jgi:hypothetical protein
MPPLPEEVLLEKEHPKTVFSCSCRPATRHVARSTPGGGRGTWDCGKVGRRGGTRPRGQRKDTHEQTSAARAPNRYPSRWAKEAELGWVGSRRGARLRAAGCLRGGCQDERNPEQMVGRLCERARQRETPIRCWEHFARGGGGDLETGWLAEEQSGLAGHRDQVAEGPREGRRVQERKRHAGGLVVWDVAVRSREVGSRTLFHPTQRTSLTAWARFSIAALEARRINSSFVPTRAFDQNESTARCDKAGQACRICRRAFPLVGPALVCEPISHMVEQPGHRFFLLSAESTRRGWCARPVPDQQLRLAANVQVPVLPGAEDLVRDARPRACLEHRQPPLRVLVRHL